MNIEAGLNVTVYLNEDEARALVRELDPIRGGRNTVHTLRNLIQAALEAHEEPYKEMYDHS